MSELLQRILDHLRGMWHRRWIGLATAWLVAVLALIGAYRVPERYEASGRIYVDTETLLKPLLAGLAIQPNLDQQVSLISRTLISRPNVEKLVHMADLDLKVRSDVERDSLIDDVMRSVRLTSGTGTNLYVLSYRDSNPEQAKKVVQSLMTIFVESSLGDKRQDSRSAVQFVDEQIKHYEETLQAAENRLKDFKLKYLGVSDGQDYFGHLAQLRANIEDAKLEVQAAEQSRDAYKRELSGETEIFLPNELTVEYDNSVPEVDARIAALKKQLDDLLRKYTDAHPDVVATNRLIGQLEDQRRATLEARRREPSKAAPAAERSPVVQQLRISLADAEASVAAARAKLAGYQSQYQQLEAKARLVPQVEAEYAQLNRDYNVQKKTYESLLARREAAGMGMGVQDTGGAQFRVIDPPRVLPEPVPPTRLQLVTIACAVSLLAGLLASFVANEVMPIIPNARALRDMSNRPILGMVSMLPSEGLRRLRRRSAYLFAGGLGALFASFTAAIFAQLLGHVV